MARDRETEAGEWQWQGHAIGTSTSSSAKRVICASLSLHLSAAVRVDAAVFDSALFSPWPLPVICMNVRTYGRVVSETFRQHNLR
jgi:hypothetical protein